MVAKPLLRPRNTSQMVPWRLRWCKKRDFLSSGFILQGAVSLLQEYNFLQSATPFVSGTRGNKRQHRAQLYFPEEFAGAEGAIPPEDEFWAEEVHDQAHHQGGAFISAAEFHPSDYDYDAPQDDYGWHEGEVEQNWLPPACEIMLSHVPGATDDPADLVNNVLQVANQVFRERTTQEDYDAFWRSLDGVCTARVIEESKWYLVFVEFAKLVLNSWCSDVFQGDHRDRCTRENPFGKNLPAHNPVLPSAASLGEWMETYFDPVVVSQKDDEGGLSPVDTMFADNCSPLLDRWADADEGISESGLVKRVVRVFSALSRDYPNAGEDFVKQTCVEDHDHQHLPRQMFKDFSHTLLQFWCGQLNFAGDRPEDEYRRCSESGNPFREDAASPTTTLPVLESFDRWLEEYSLADDVLAADQGPAPACENLLETLYNSADPTEEQTREAESRSLALRFLPAQAREDLERYCQKTGQRLDSDQDWPDVARTILANIDSNIKKTLYPGVLPAKANVDPQAGLSMNYGELLQRARASFQNGGFADWCNQHVEPARSGSYVIPDAAHVQQVFRDAGAMGGAAQEAMERLADDVEHQGNNLEEKCNMFFQYLSELEQSAMRSSNGRDGGTARGPVRSTTATGVGSSNSGLGAGAGPPASGIGVGTTATATVSVGNTPPRPQPFELPALYVEMEKISQEFVGHLDYVTSELQLMTRSRGHDAFHHFVDRIFVDQMFVASYLLPVLNQINHHGHNLAVPWLEKFARNLEESAARFGVDLLNGPPAQKTRALSDTVERYLEHAAVAAQKEMVGLTQQDVVGANTDVTHKQLSEMPELARAMFFTCSSTTSGDVGRWPRPEAASAACKSHVSLVGKAVALTAKAEFSPVVPGKEAEASLQHAAFAITVHGSPLSQAFKGFSVLQPVAQYNQVQIMGAAAQGGPGALAAPRQHLMPYVTGLIAAQGKAPPFSGTKGKDINTADRRRVALIAMQRFQSHLTPYERKLSELLDGGWFQHFPKLYSFLLDEDTKKIFRFLGMLKPPAPDRAGQEWWKWQAASNLVSSGTAGAGPGVMQELNTAAELVARASSTPPLLQASQAPRRKPFAEVLGTPSSGAVDAPNFQDALDLKLGASQYPIPGGSQAAGPGIAPSSLEQPYPKVFALVTLAKTAARRLYDADSASSTLGASRSDFERDLWKPLTDAAISEFHSPSEVTTEPALEAACRAEVEEWLQGSSGGGDCVLAKRKLRAAEADLEQFRHGARQSDESLAEAHSRADARVEEERAKAAQALADKDHELAEKERELAAAVAARDSLDARLSVASAGHDDVQKAAQDSVRIAQDAKEKAERDAAESQHRQEQLLKEAERHRKASQEALEKARVARELAETLREQVTTLKEKLQDAQQAIKNAKRDNEALQEGHEAALANLRLENEQQAQQHREEMTGKETEVAKLTDALDGVQKKRADEGKSLAEINKALEEERKAWKSENDAAKGDAENAKNNHAAELADLQSKQEKLGQELEETKRQLAEAKADAANTEQANQQKVGTLEASLQEALRNAGKLDEADTRRRERMQALGERMQALKDKFDADYEALLARTTAEQEGSTVLDQIDVARRSTEFQASLADLQSNLEVRKSLLLRNDHADEEAPPDGAAQYEEDAARWQELSATVKRRLEELDAQAREAVAKKNRWRQEREEEEEGERRKETERQADRLRELEKAVEDAENKLQIASARQATEIQELLAANQKRLRESETARDKAERLKKDRDAELEELKTTHKEAEGNLEAELDKANRQIEEAQRLLREQEQKHAQELKAKEDALQAAMAKAGEVRELKKRKRLRMKELEEEFTKGHDALAGDIATERRDEISQGLIDELFRKFSGDLTGLQGNLDERKRLFGEDQAQAIESRAYTAENFFGKHEEDSGRLAALSENVRTKVEGLRLEQQRLGQEAEQAEKDRLRREREEEERKQREEQEAARRKALEEKQREEADEKERRRLQAERQEQQKRVEDEEARRAVEEQKRRQTEEERTRREAGERWEADMNNLERQYIETRNAFERTLEQQLPTQIAALSAGDRLGEEGAAANLFTRLADSTKLAELSANVQRRGDLIKQVPEKQNGPTSVQDPSARAGETHVAMYTRHASEVTDLQAGWVEQIQRKLNEAEQARVARAEEERRLKEAEEQNNQKEICNGNVVKLEHAYIDTRKEFEGRLGGAIGGINADSPSLGSTAEAFLSSLKPDETLQRLRENLNERRQLLSDAIGAAVAGVSSTVSDPAFVPKTTPTRSTTFMGGWLGMGGTQSPGAAGETHDEMYQRHSAEVDRLETAWLGQVRKKLDEAKATLEEAQLNQASAAITTSEQQYIGRRDRFQEELTQLLRDVRDERSENFVYQQTDAVLAELQGNVNFRHTLLYDENGAPLSEVGSLQTTVKDPQRTTHDALYRFHHTQVYQTDAGGLREQWRSSIAAKLAELENQQRAEQAQRAQEQTREAAGGLIASSITPLEEAYVRERDGFEGRINGPGDEATFAALLEDVQAVLDSLEHNVRERENLLSEDGDVAKFVKSTTTKTVDKNGPRRMLAAVAETHGAMLLRHKSEATEIGANWQEAIQKKLDAAATKNDHELENQVRASEGEYDTIKKSFEQEIQNGSDPGMVEGLFQKAGDKINELGLNWQRRNSLLMTPDVGARVATKNASGGRRHGELLQHHSTELQTLGTAWYGLIEQRKAELESEQEAARAKEDAKTEAKERMRHLHTAYKALLTNLDAGRKSVASCVDEGSLAQLESQLVDLLGNLGDNVRTREADLSTNADAFSQDTSFWGMGTLASAWGGDVFGGDKPLVYKDKVDFQRLKPQVEKEIRDRRTAIQTADGRRGQMRELGGEYATRQQQLEAWGSTVQNPDSELNHATDAEQWRTNADTQFVIPLDNAVGRGEGVLSQIARDNKAVQGLLMLEADQFRVATQTAKESAKKWREFLGDLAANRQGEIEAAQRARATEHFRAEMGRLSAGTSQIMKQLQQAVAQRGVEVSNCQDEAQLKFLEANQRDVVAPLEENIRAQKDVIEEYKDKVDAQGTRDAAHYQGEIQKVEHQVVAKAKEQLDSFIADRRTAIKQQQNADAEWAKAVEASEIEYERIRSRLDQELGPGATAATLQRLLQKDYEETKRQLHGNLQTRWQLLTNDIGKRLHENSSLRPNSLYGRSPNVGQSFQAVYTKHKTSFENLDRTTGQDIQNRLGKGLDEAAKLTDAIDGITNERMKHFNPCIDMRQAMPLAQRQRLCKTAIDHIESAEKLVKENQEKERNKPASAITEENLTAWTAFAPDRMTATGSWYGKQELSQLAKNMRRYFLDVDPTSGQKALGVLAVRKKQANDALQAAVEQDNERQRQQQAAAAASAAAAEAPPPPPPRLSPTSGGGGYGPPPPPGGGYGQPPPPGGGGGYQGSIFGGMPSLLAGLGTTPGHPPQPGGQQPHLPPSQSPPPPREVAQDPHYVRGMVFEQTDLNQGAARAARTEAPLTHFWLAYGNLALTLNRTRVVLMYGNQIWSGPSRHPPAPLLRDTGTYVAPARYACESIFVLFLHSWRQGILALPRRKTACVRLQHL
ncbi:unnamed protein product [Amoebophrya sp. A120]|nr:unnamed protein product [Amoebophrya sp. A120]|eukprot:GSA120T00014175001.1